MLFNDTSRRVTRSVRFLLNGKPQESESVVLSLIQAEDFSYMLMLLEWCEPCTSIESCGFSQMNRHAALSTLNGKINLES